MEKKYNILLISNSGKFISALSNILSTISYDNVEFCSKLSLANEFNSKSYDIVIIDSKNEKIEEIVELKKHFNSEVVAILNSDQIETSKKLAAVGVNSLLKPVTGEVLIQMYLMLCTAREKIMKIDSSDIKYDQKVNDIRLLDQAKLLLISNRKITEDQAHRFIEKQAMEQRITKIESARQILTQYGM